ncbi:MAG: hypothetical protein V1694_01140 [Candidatus Eisenbacteria bacterium]
MAGKPIRAKLGRRALATQWGTSEMITRNWQVMAITLCVLLSLTSGCGDSAAKRKAAAERATRRDAVANAIDALRKMEAATQVDVSYEQYGQLLIDAKAKVNNALSVLPDTVPALKDLSTELSGAVDNYYSAKVEWGYKIKWQGSDYRIERVAALCAEEIRDRCWKTASERLASASRIASLELREE